MRQLFMTLLICLTAGCASAPPPPSLATTEHVVKSNFSVGVEQSASVGDPLVSIKDFYITTQAEPSWTLPQPVQIIFSLGSAPASPGVYPILGRKVVDGIKYDIINMRSLPVLVDEQGRIGRIGAAMGPLTSEAHALPAEVVLTRMNKTTVDVQRGYTNFELIYTGLSGDTIRLTYREYSPDNLARTAFFQDLTYNRSQKLIRFRKISIEVVNASNEAIRFKVLQDN